jgi:PAS domain S-box-containing protein
LVTKGSVAASKRLAAVVRGSSDAIYTIDLDGCISSWNAAAERIFGHSANEIVGRSSDVLVPDRLRSEEAELIASVRRGESVHHIQTERLRRGGRRIAMSLSLGVVEGDDSEIEGISVIGRDVTAQSARDRHNEFLIRASSILFASLDIERTLNEVTQLIVPTLADLCVIHLATEDGELDSCRPAAVHHRDPDTSRLVRLMIEQYPPRADALNGPTKVFRTGTPDFLPTVPDDFPERVSDDPIRTQMLRALNVCSTLSVPLQSQGRVIGVLTLTMTQGRMFAYEDLAFAEQLALRVAVAIENARMHSTVARSLSDEVAATFEELQHANELLTVSEQRIRDFLDMASHELRTPLTAIAGFSSTVLQRWDALSEHERRKFMEIIDTQSQRLVRLVNDLLQLSRIDRRTPLGDGTEVVDVAEVISAVLLDMDCDEMVVRCAPGARARIPRDQLIQILVNYLANAVKYAAAPYEITVQSDEHFTTIHVSDSGSGVPESFAPYLFEPFTQADPSKHDQGTGLGLSIVRGLAIAHGGAAWYEPSDPTGACFAVRLPNECAPRPLDPIVLD